MAVSMVVAAQWVELVAIIRVAIILDAMPEYLESIPDDKHDLWRLYINSLQMNSDYFGEWLQAVVEGRPPALHPLIDRNNVYSDKMPDHQSEPRGGEGQ
jgi:hypothetical protein